MDAIESRTIDEVPFRMPLLIWIGDPESTYVYLAKLDGDLPPRKGDDCCLNKLCT